MGVPTGALQDAARLEGQRAETVRAPSALAGSESVPAVAAELDVTALDFEGSARFDNPGFRGAGRHVAAVAAGAVAPEFGHTGAPAGAGNEDVDAVAVDRRRTGRSLVDSECLPGVAENDAILVKDDFQPRAVAGVHDILDFERGVSERWSNPNRRVGPVRRRERETGARKRDGSESFPWQGFREKANVETTALILFIGEIPGRLVMFFEIDDWNDEVIPAGIRYNRLSVAGQTIGHKK